MSVKIAIVYHSGYGHTEVIAKSIAKGAETAAEAHVALISVENADIEALNDFDAIVFGAPTYMGGPSAAFKTFADASSKAWMKRTWQDKIAAGFTNSMYNSGDKSATLLYLATLASQHGMLWLSLGIPGDPSPEGLNRNGYNVGLGAQSDNAPADVTPNEAEQRTAEAFGARIAESTRRWVAGKATGG